MARLPRIVVPNQPLHIMHRGNNRQDIFVSEEDLIRMKDDIEHSLYKALGADSQQRSNKLPKNI